MADLEPATTEDVRECFASGAKRFDLWGDHTEGDYRREFDRWLAEHDREVRVAALAPIKKLAEQIMFDHDAEPARVEILAEIERQTSDGSGVAP